MEDADVWPLSMVELISAREKLLPRLSLVEQISTLTDSIVESGGDFTHKCRCPFHKGGRERTPSFNFSQTTGRYTCFGCGVFGDTFDILSLTTGTPWFKLVEKMVSPSDLLELEDVESDPLYNSEILFEANLALSTTIRDWLEANRTKENTVWADQVFAKIDERFSKLTSTDRLEILQFKIQIEMDLHRRSS